MCKSHSRLFAEFVQEQGRWIIISIKKPFIIIFDSRVLLGGRSNDPTNSIAGSRCVS